MNFLWAKGLSVLTAELIYNEPIKILLDRGIVNEEITKTYVKREWETLY